MSFIAGLVFGDLAPRTDLARTQAGAILAAGRGRGADDTGLWTGQGVAFGVRMHRIRDLTPDGGQPWVSANGRMVVAFDGHLSNVQTLRRDLEEAGIRLRGHGDAELVAEAAAHWGLNHLLQKIESAFAIALWDTENSALHLVRDRLGTRPLYVTKTKNGFAFASDIQSFRALEGFKPAINPEAAAAYLAWGYVAPPLTLWSDVISLPPSHRLMLRSTDAALPTPEAYWSPATTLEEIAMRGGTGDNTLRLDRLTATLCREAIRIDVPFGLLMDDNPSSPALRTTLDRASDKPFKAVILSAPDGAALQTAFDALAQLGEPVSDPRAPTWWNALRRTNGEAPVCMAACTLSRLQLDAEPNARMRRILSHLPTPLHRFVPKRFAHLVQNVPDLFAARASHWPDTAPLHEPLEPRLELPQGSRLAFYDFALSFCCGLMPALDRVAGSCGIELRVPLADVRMLEFGLPADGNIDYDHAAIWLRGPLRPRLQDLMTPALFARIGITDTSAYTLAWRNFLAGDNTLTARIWTLGTLLAWTKATS